MSASIPQTLSACTQRMNICQGARLVCPGMLRTLVTKAMGYHVHAAEYGEHWNFFLTLGVLPVLSALANIPPQWLLPAGERAPAMRAQAGFSLRPDSKLYVKVRVTPADTS